MPAPARHCGFDRRRRLLRTGQFDGVFKLRRSVSDDYLVVYAAPSPEPLSRLGLSVGRRVGPSVRRNRLKRLLREAFRTARDLPAGFDFVVVAKKGSCNAAYKTLESSLVSLALRACDRCRD